jgi:hypothetical protein
MTIVTDLLIDTDILVDVGRNDPRAITYLQTKSMTYRLAISVITHMELLVGAQNKTEQRKIERFLRRFSMYPLSESISRNAVDLLRQYRLSHGLLMPDAFIAATAISNTLPLASKNQRDYRFIAQLTVLPYP